MSIFCTTSRTTSGTSEGFVTSRRGSGYLARGVLNGWLVLVIALLSAVAGGAQLNFDRHPVTARLLFDDAGTSGAGLSAGDTLTAAIVLSMEDHWHTYWANSGDAGLPTKVEWGLPDGWQAGPLHWPGPNRYTESGDLTVFGYADRVTLLTTLTVGDQTTATPVEITANVSWLVCAEICIPGDTTLTVSLGPATIDPDLIAAARATVIQPWTAADSSHVTYEATVQSSPDGSLDVQISLTGTARAADGLPDVFPLSAGEDVYILAGTRRVDAGAVDVRFGVVPYAGESAPEQMTAVVAYHDAQGQAQYRQVNLDLIAVAADAGVDLLATDFGLHDANRSIWIYLLMALVGGAILNLMPCVLPVISLKVMALVSQAGESAGRVRQLGLAFSAGVVATFVLLGLIVIALKSTGEQIGWGFQFQSPAFVIALAALVFVLALSLFGVVNIRLPGSSGTLGGLADREGVVGSFANGILATILATPCTAPFLGSALGFAFSQPASTTMAVFTTTGVGMALPYALLAWRPGWVQRLPAPGPWMERFKQSMAFLLMATSLWLLWVLGRQLGMEAVVWTTGFLLCLAMAATLVGQWLDLRSSRRRRRVIWVIAILIAGVGYHQMIHPLLTQEPATRHSLASDDRWQPFDRQQVEELIGAGRTVFIDFTADWCWTCKVNERVVLNDADVMAAFTAGDVVLMKADWTNRDAEITQMLHAFGRPGVPLYVIFAGGRADAPTILPEVITRDIVLEALEQSRSAD
ncbi:MAG: hypothetical protein HN712_25770 [Gemmatimonadetes bacterium]|jgi:thiol:disulfide interchange protein|nr:hypothetical protein [Gemmatimonadota bacterium]MBT6149544.1 hypothetical protein [Gemmatimonadota bacterium]MBT7863751.1 hypothetical protein [Gemmatimonadota bacterium]